VTLFFYQNPGRKPCKKFEHPEGGAVKFSGCLHSFGLGRATSSGFHGFSRAIQGGPLFFTGIVTKQRLPPSKRSDSTYPSA
jgi:hypothetical protein